MIEGFEIVDSDLQDLGPEDAVLFFRELVWASAADAGVPRSSVHVPTEIHVGDGGLDAKIEEAEPAQDDCIPEGTSGFQIKSSDTTYSSWKDDVRVDDGLQPRITRLLDEGGTYVLVIFEELVGVSSDRPEMDKRERWEDTLIGEFTDQGYDDPAVRVYDSTRLAGFVNEFPSLIARLKDLDPARDYSTWQRSERIGATKFVADASREQQIEAIRSLVRSSRDDCPVIRIAGLPGIGKTRLVFEALAPEDLQSRVLYFHAHDFQCSGLATRLERNEAWAAIVVVDNCDEDEHEDFVRQLGSQSDRLALITISDDVNPVESDYSARLEPLTTGEVVEILQEKNPEVDESRLKRIAEFAQGFPRFAHMLSDNIDPDPSSSSDNLLDFETETPLRRLILGRDPEVSVINEHRRVLEVFSLFEKVGWNTDDGGFHPEAEWVALMSGFSGTDGIVRFREIVELQRDRGVLHGEYYLAVRPLPLATYLLQSWWETHGMDELLDKIPPDMVSQFGERIPFMSTFDMGRKWISMMLGPAGPFYQDEGAVLDTEIGSQLFFKLAEADPRRAVDLLHDLLIQKSMDELLAFRTGRRQVVHALEYIAVWEDTFEYAARLLLLLGEAENEEWANNASGIFASLFAPGIGKVAPTEKPAEERIPILREALQSQSLRRQQLGLNAAKAALKSPGRQFRTVGPEFQGARPTPNLWMPETYGDLFDYYRAVWQMLNNELSSLDEELRPDAVEVLTGCVRSLATLHPSLSRMVREGLEELRQVEWVDEQPIIRAAVSLIEYDGEQLQELDDEREQWETFVHQLTEASYERKLRRFVGQSLISDHETYEVKLAELANEGISNPEKFEAELSWLVTSDSNRVRSHEFGYEVGQRDTELQFLDTIIESVGDTDDPTISFLSGYLSALPDEYEDRRQSVLDWVEEDDDLRSLLLDLIRLSGMTSEDARRVVEGLRSGTINPVQLQGLQLGGVSRNIDEPVFRDLAEYLLRTYNNGQRQGNWLSEVLGTVWKILTRSESTDEEPQSPPPGALILLPIFFHYYVYPDDGPSLPEKLTIELLTDPVFTVDQEEQHFSGQIAHDWKNIARELVTQHPDARDELVGVILENFGARNVMVGHNREVTGFLEKLFVDNPDEMWPEVADMLVEMDSRSVLLCRWLAGDMFDSSGPITEVNATRLWEWVDQDREQRAPLIAAAVPATFFHDEDRVCLARQLLKRHGDVEGVNDAVSANYRTESWTGPSSEHYTQKKQELIDFKENETDSQVIFWINQEISGLDQRINQAKQFEERIGL